MLHPLAASDSKGSRACGLYEKLGSRHLISIEENLLSNPINLIATIAYELAHARLSAKTDFQTTAKTKNY